MDRLTPAVAGIGTVVPYRGLAGRIDIVPIPGSPLAQAIEPFAPGRQPRPTEADLQRLDAMLGGRDTPDFDIICDASGAVVLSTTRAAIDGASPAAIARLTEVLRDVANQQLSTGREARSAGQGVEQSPQGFDPARIGVMPSMSAAIAVAGGIRPEPGAGIDPATLLRPAVTVAPTGTGVEGEQPAVRPPVIATRPPAGALGETFGPPRPPSAPGQPTPAGPAAPGQARPQGQAAVGGHTGEVQRQLNELGLPTQGAPNDPKFIAPGREPDGHAGPHTQAAVRRVQAALGMEQNGQMNDDFRAQLNQAMSDPARRAALQADIARQNQPQNREQDGAAFVPPAPDVPRALAGNRGQGAAR